jgi:hypothetical protein
MTTDEGVIVIRISSFFRHSDFVIVWGDSSARDIFTGCACGASGARAAGVSHLRLSKL